jgi:hypothetical protein
MRSVLPVKDNQRKARRPIMEVSLVSILIVLAIIALIVFIVRAL